jgi:hypothetical protein
LIHHKQRWRQIWDYFIILVAAYSTFFIPIQLSFKPWGVWYDVVDVITLFIYILDVLVQMRTTYQNIFGDEITDAKQIMKNYCYSSRFAIDLMSLFANPATAKIPNPAGELIQFFGVLKLVRMTRINILISQVNLERNVKSTLKILYYTLILFIYIHITGCLWFYAIENNKTTGWVPPFDFIDSSKSVFYTKLDGTDQDWDYQYFVCLYYGVLVIGGNELGPTDITELIYIVAINVMGAIFNAGVFGELAVLLSNVSRADSNQQGVIDTANTAMENIDLPTPIRQQVREYFQKVQSTSDKQEELDTFL